MSPGLDFVSFGLFMAAWAAGMAAMMLPSSLPIVFLLAKGDKYTGGRKGTDPALFLLGYLGSWTAVGIFAFVGSVLAVGYLPHSNGITGLAGVASGALVFLAGAYQLSPAKQKALRECRSPMTFVLTSWRSGLLGRLVMGADYSVFCITCCWAIMAILVLVGAMSLLWMVFFAGVIFVERVLPPGLGFSKAFGGVLMVSGAAIAGLGLL
jgi:predicted metal-binding membrane protein